jgi:DNA-binding LacI/PurR family transcriptional regulator
MTVSASQVPRLLEIASKIEADIRGRGLRPGDAYSNTEEVSRLLGISKSTANRAMQLLAKRGLVHRRQRLGVVVGDAIAQTNPLPICRLHILAHQNYLKTEGVLGDGVLIGMQSALPGIDVQVNYMSHAEDSDNAARMISASLRSPHREGFVLVRAPLAIQRLIESLELPAVVFGTLYPSVHRLPWIDFDHRQTARLLVEHTLAGGHRNILYLGRDRVFPGDYPFLDSMIASLNEAGLPLSALTVRQMPADRELIRAEVGAWLADKTATSNNGGAGIIARTEPLADGAAAAVEAMGLKIGEDVALTASAVYRVGNEKPLAYPHICPAIDPREIGERVGRLLVNHASDQTGRPDHEIIPVYLDHPKSERN